MGLGFLIFSTQLFVFSLDPVTTKSVDCSEAAIKLAKHTQLSLLADEIVHLSPSALNSAKLLERVNQAADLSIQMPPTNTPAETVLNSSVKLLMNSADEPLAQSLEQVKRTIKNNMPSNSLVARISNLPGIRVVAARIPGVPRALYGWQQRFQSVDELLRSLETNIQDGVAASKERVIQLSSSSIILIQEAKRAEHRAQVLGDLISLIEQKIDERQTLSDANTDTQEILRRLRRAQRSLNEMGIAYHSAASKFKRIVAIASDNNEEAHLVLNISLPVFRLEASALLSISAELDRMKQFQAIRFAQQRVSEAAARSIQEASIEADNNLDSSPLNLQSLKQSIEQGRETDAARKTARANRASTAKKEVGDILELLKKARDANETLEREGLVQQTSNALITTAKR